ncbi:MULTISPECIES: chemotaxis protein CheB [unclassified Mesorhizobium]|uniref:chemotaxis protein CheB n=1 Tax=unclassified Mesorhizobium TaxID=325217 RepID=UPI0003CE9D7B|nr:MULTISPECIES: chemotaxis protein CheB [unclassified Mesorhizobium]ESY44948.1 hypothetical protein X745_31825 [Mesorhizobium sp. LNJC374B00]ESY48090.1 hypothetical protein X744_32445 [Mesorhizobium sp. LNJC372A00]WJI79416.1 chemotaxis protein CheB [Mesorhizobium sp. C374B]WJI85951.1 chemotaxis protein CheB [Mesorhizobium sp. C372A]
MRVSTKSATRTDKRLTADLQPQKETDNRPRIDMYRHKVAAASDENITLSPSVVAIGASGGQGLNDILELLARLPTGLPAIFLVVLHRPSDGVSFLRDVLARSSNMPVNVAVDGGRYHLGTCYIGEPDAHLSLCANSGIALVEGAHHKHRNRTVDILFKSVAAYAQDRGIGIILSGSLDDGSRGLAALGKAGGITMVITENGSAERGMPFNAAHFDGPIDVMGNAYLIADEIVRRVRENSSKL